MQSKPLVILNSTHTINGVVVGNSLESAERIQNATVALFELIDKHDLSDHELKLVLQIAFPNLK